MNSVAMQPFKTFRVSAYTAAEFCSHLEELHYEQIKAISFAKNKINKKDIC